MAYVEVRCRCCPDKFMARIADRRRGWGKFCSKSCAAYWKEHKSRRPHQTLEMREAAIHRNNVERSQREDRIGGPREFVYINGFGCWDDHKDNGL